MNEIICPRCDSENIVKNGNTSYGKPRYMCKDCRRHFVENPANGKISDEKKELTDKMLLEKIPLAGIMTIQCDEMWSFVGSKKINIRYGLQLILIQEELSELISVIGEKKEPRVFGTHHLRCIVNALLFTQIFGNRMRAFSPRNVIRLSRKAAVRQVMWKG